jgi:phosphoglycolate phosphatase-like HAD superfamily hydrolase
VLYLFDIDGTLVDTGGAGMKSLQEASLEIFGHEGPALVLAGSTDLGVIANIHSHFQVDSTPEAIEAFFQAYLKRLDWNLTHGGFTGQIFDGVVDLLAELSKLPDVAIGLLTGNIADGAAVKMRHFGLSAYFPFGAYGSDQQDRNLLGPIALERAATHAARPFSAGETWVIGDTPKDIACAHAIGARCLAVATGRFSEAELKQAGADAVVASLVGALPLLLQ